MRQKREPLRTRRCCSVQPRRRCRQGDGRTCSPAIARTRRAQRRRSACSGHAAFRIAARRGGGSAMRFRRLAFAARRGRCGHSDGHQPGATVLGTWQHRGRRRHLKSQCQQKPDDEEATQTHSRIGHSPAIGPVDRRQFGMAPHKVRILGRTECGHRSSPPGRLFGGCRPPPDRPGRCQGALRIEVTIRSSPFCSAVNLTLSPSFS